MFTGIVQGISRVSNVIDFENGTGIDSAFKNYGEYTKGGGRIGSGDLELLDSSKNLAFRNKKKKDVGLLRGRCSENKERW